MERLLAIIQTRPSQFRGTVPEVLLLTPPIINEDTEYCRKGDKYLGATDKARELVGVYERLATKMGIGLIALNGITPGVDGIHIDADQHAKIANLVYRSIKDNE